MSEDPDCVCLVLFCGVKLEVESVFEEKIASGAGMDGWMDVEREVLFFLSFQKQASLSGLGQAQGGAVRLSAGC